MHCLAEERRHLKEEEEGGVEGGDGGGAEGVLPLPGEVAAAPHHPVRHLGRACHPPQRSCMN